MNNNAAVGIVTALIVLGAIGAGAGATYVYVENEKASHVTPEETIYNYNTDDNTDETEEQQTTITKVELSTPLVKEKVKEYIDISDEQASPIEIYIDKLNVEVYGLNNTDVPTIIEKYRQKMSDDGYEIIYEDSRSGNGWSGQLIFGKSTLHGRAIAAISGSSVSTLFKHDVILITSHGYLTDYNNCKDLIMQKCETC